MSPLSTTQHKDLKDHIYEIVQQAPTWIANNWGGEWMQMESDAHLKDLGIKGRV